jgi:hypothetical protein
MLIVLYLILWYKGNAKLIYNIDFQPWQWWLYTGLITNYLGLLSWWHLVTHYSIWTATAVTYSLHAIVELCLNYFHYGLPNFQQGLGISLLIIGSFLVLK